MKISESWLREWVNPPLTSQELSSQLTMAGLEVDSCYPVAGVFDRVIVAHVLQTRRHPQADKLTLCDVDVGEVEPLQIVCGASNVRAGLKVALALIGANLPGDIRIKESKLRGEVSQGMLCSVTELGLDERSEGILELPEDAPIGTDLRDYLVLNDYVYDIDLTPNRADCLSVLGLARDVAALNNLPLKSLPNEIIPPSIDDRLSIELQVPGACPQYAGRVIRDINSQAVTPLWMKERLRRCGLRPLHPVVDVTNYVMLELGQPMHAFDLKTLQGGIQVRQAKQNESLVLLDGQEINLDPNVLIIADDEKPLAMAGIMGGDDSAVKLDTTDIFLESAFFNPLAITGVARRYGLSSDSSQRYERGVDPLLQRIALERATYLLQSIVGGKVGPIELVSHSNQLPYNKTIQFNPNKVRRLSGLDITHRDMEQMLKSLEMKVVGQEDCWHVTAPSHRFDIAYDVDLVEEIIRLYGYDKIQPAPLQVTMHAGEINLSDRMITTISSFLATKGYRETISYSFVDPQLQQVLYPEQQTISLLNPISSELSQMRVGMWSGLLASMIHNVHRQQSALKLFESGVVFHAIDGKIQEFPCIAGLMMGEHGQLNWSESPRVYDFYDMKGDLQTLFSSLKKQNIQFIPDVHPALHPGKAARIVCDSQELGWLGVLHPRLNDEFDLNQEVILFELSLLPMISHHTISYQPISKYPQTRRDLSLIVDNDVNALQIEQVVREVVDPSCLKAFNIFDVYVGDSIPKNKKSLAIALTLQNDNRTLVDTEINAIIEAILKKLDEAFSVVLRAV
ncbi:MAG: phenylalanine--tRNA ligase subunit beta [Legionellaceae bacterium]|nr:phenylalanine--tRNA ligase subunit beta [Legionellaceae bacterium]